MRLLQVRPTLHDFSICYPPNDDPTKCDALIRIASGASPVRTTTRSPSAIKSLNLYMTVGKPFISSAHILLRSGGTWSGSGRHVRTMIDKFRRKIHGGDIQIPLIHRLQKVVAHKIFHCSKVSPVFGFTASLLVAFMLWQPVLEIGQQIRSGSHPFLLADDG